MEKIKLFFVALFKAIGKFLKYTYAAQITIAVFGLLKLIPAIIFGNGWYMLLGILLIVWAGLLTWNEYVQNK